MKSSKRLLAEMICHFYKEIVGDRNSSFGFGSAETLGFGFGFFGFGFGFGFGQ